MLRAELKHLRFDELKALRHQVLITKVAIIKILSERLDRKVFWLRPIDEYRLLTLQMWADKYKVSLEFVVTTLIAFWSTIIRGRAKGGLGVKIHTLVGKKSLKVLQEAILRSFPAGENIDEWRWQKRMELINTGHRGYRKPTTILDTDNIRDFCNMYTKRMAWRGKQIDLAVGDPSRRRRLYRNSPWI